MQNPHAVVMIRPTFFGVNPETALDNAFQTEGAAGDREAALREFDAMTFQLTAAGVSVHIFEQDREDTPDAVFPNNWFSTHHDGRLVTYPMLVPSRRRERRGDILEELGRTYQVSGALDLSGNEADALFLEGTGAIVFDHERRIGYLAQSLRADAELFLGLCRTLDYEAAIFEAFDAHGHPIYHTNVMLSIGANIVLAGLDCVTDLEERQMLEEDFASSDRLVVELDQKQIANFAGNALEVDTAEGPVLVISKRGWEALTVKQQVQIEQRVRILTPDLPTIEKSGGSARCMMAGVHLPLRQDA
ncbi:citrulline utilization hydrolase CtlX [Parvularcula maris]|uniref:Arginine deiminase-related protein n=1 Tax=Parvularcula maris TaxID=2965077 RepID=A0A9X2L8E3_9PROT|nr:arginine deiminase-related protein [Parvularcula maris]MCQ8184873.1 arginine deiminase-related protein [Parvularcula maris]